MSSTFGLHDGDRVVFLGDSITAQRLYTAYVETAVHARYPEWNIEFYNAGVGGDNVFGGVAGNIDTRLSRDVLNSHPTVITIMLGMNDRGHPEKYEEGYKHILQVLHDKASSARIVVLAPTPVDGVTNKNPDANKELLRYLEIDRRLAATYGATLIDLFHPVETALERADNIDHLAAVSLIPDRIHPQPPLHMLMAETILRGLGFPADASYLAIDASTTSITRSDGVIPRDLQRKGNSLSWSERETPDEVRFLRTDGNEILYEKLLGVNHPGARILKIEALPRGIYSLEIDGKTLNRTWTDSEFATGIDLQMEDTPAHKSGVNLYYACFSAENDQTERSLQLGALKANDVALEAAARTLFQAAIIRSREKIKASSTRVERRIELVQVVQSPR